MSLSYVGNAKGVCLDMNVAGCGLLAELHKLAGLPVIGSGHRVPYVACADDAYAWGGVLQYFAVPEAAKEDTVDLGDIEDLKDVWVTFLMTCGGYEAI